MTTAQAKERPILFSPVMIRALLDGRKTQTRRILKPQPPTEAATQSTPYSIGPAVARGTGIYSMNDHDAMPKEPGVFDAYGSVGVVRTACGQTTWACPYGVPGDRLWVRENTRIIGWGHLGEVQVEYPADGASLTRQIPLEGADRFAWERWNERMCEKAEALGAAYANDGALNLDGIRFPVAPSIYMPRWASRISLEIMGVRLERLHDISDPDALAEGIRFPADQASAAQGEPRELFLSLWDSINGAGSWDLNPYVWVVEFKTLEARA